MVELRLPKNSRISPNGKVWDHKKSSAKKLRKFKVYRYNPDEKSNDTQIDLSSIIKKIDLALEK